MASRRIALLGFSLESNGFAPVARRSEFEEHYFLVGNDLAVDIRAPHPRVAGTVSGFVERMDREGAWELVPIAVARTSPSGPVDQEFFDAFVADVVARLRAAGPLDGVYISEHGAASATVDPDPDGTLFAAVREVVGPAVPVVATLDLHANVSQTMVEATDLLVAYRTNPHVDMFERGVEAADAMIEMFAGLRTAKAMVKLPLMPPSLTQRTEDGPYGDAIRAAEQRMGGEILNVSTCAGFFLTDSPKSGMTVVVTSRRDQAAASQTALELAQAVWEDRHRYVPRLTSMDEAVARLEALMANSALPPLAFADVADNPGGGGRGNTTFLLRAFLEAGARDVALGVFYDPALAAAARAAGQGGRFRATFNAEEMHPLSERLEADAQVLALSDGDIVGSSRGHNGRTIRVGCSARLRVGAGIDVIVTSLRVQCTDPAMVTHFGVDLGRLRAFVVKSRGHFRAGFAPWFGPDRIVEVDAPGLATQVLSRLPYAKIPRPMFPIDPETTWEPRVIAC